MIKFKWFRWVKSLLGYSSFVSINDQGGTSYFLIRGDRGLVEYLQEKYPQEY